MRLASQLLLVVGALLFVALGGAGLTIWSAQQSAFQLERASAAHRVYEGYLSLSNHTYQLFKQFGDGMLIGDRDRGTGESELLEKIRADIAKIRNLIGHEIDIVDESELEEEIGELDHLARIERKIESLLAEYQYVLGAKNEIPFTENWGRLSRMLDTTIDEEFSELISTAIESETEEVRETREQAAEAAGFFESLALGFGCFSLIVAALALWKLLRDIREPVERLLHGASALERGELEHRVEIAGPVELNEVAKAFNRMADEISNREKALVGSKETLEQTVAARTAELEALLETLKNSEANRRRLLADVSHELRTPLTIIRGEAEIALRGEPKPPEVYREALVKCCESADHTARLVDDLLFVARSEGQGVRLQLEEIDLATFVPRVLEQCHGLVGAEHARIEFGSEVERAVVRADEQRIRQTTVILLDNALRYGATHVVVRLALAPAGYRISVSDDGPGLSRDEQASAFDRFFRGSNAAERYAGGAGLGLPVAKAIVEAHGGEINLSGELGEGLTVSFSLPGQRHLRAVS